MNAALFNVIEYFQHKQLSFKEYFTHEFLDSLDKKVQDNNYLLNDAISNEMFDILSKTATQCQLPIRILINHLKLAIIGFDERTNDFNDLLEEYITHTEDPTLADLNKKLDPSWALTNNEVALFNGLFSLYCQILLSTEKEIPAVQIPVASSSELLKQPSKVPTSTEQSIGLECESKLKCVWIESDVEKYYEAYCNAISPATSIHFKPDEFLAETSDDWVNCRIFLCLSVRAALEILPKIHRKFELYRIYVLGNDKKEEHLIPQNEEAFSKRLLFTSDQDVLVRQLSLDIIQTFQEIGDLYLNTHAYGDAERWYQSVLDKINEYGSSKEKILVPIIQQKLSKCSR
ncbi:unnamed protein product [Rotaria sp. Silwood1]|nr:unnamed protein product [Rotaria sp. Silwood1]CAF1636906.1 unnamed protein product [Rotaria sp. Silwood1]CAF3784580.1 unnamed protein product [Rotaria sp. Silwood1]CAF3784599.1 unnamed protein product [Rotaria sp. Silwood1]CAF4961135.1 unnamed protein product [Rotaria sp. Silwood1]